MRPVLAVALALSAWASWAAWRGPPPSGSFSAPEPLSRASSQASIQALQQVSDQLNSAIADAIQRHGRALKLHELEGHDAQGIPFLPFPIPDNPLVAGVSTLVEQCPPHPTEAVADWLYCPETGEVTAAIPGHSP